MIGYEQTIRFGPGPWWDGFDAGLGLGMTMMWVALFFGAGPGMAMVRRWLGTEE
jgi:hypothetical protein